MSEVLRFPAPGPWITRDLKLCVLASDYDALADRLDKAEQLLRSVVHDEDHGSGVTCGVLNEIDEFLGTETAANRGAEHE
jgi:hypothetical protein